VNEGWNRHALYPRQDRWFTLVVPALRAMGAKEVARRTGTSRRAVERAIRPRRPTTPHASTRAVLTRAAGNWAAERLRAEAPLSGHDSLGFLFCLLRTLPLVNAQPRRPI
jgi:hypothetical protein